MPIDDGHDIVIVSDFHLSSGYDPRTGAYQRNEDFFYDASFARLLAALTTQARTENRRWRLLILGDLCDFLQVVDQRQGPLAQPRSSLPDTSLQATNARLDQIAAGHAEFFAALGRFVADGFLVDIVPGNHDIELMRPGAQEHFKRLVAQACGQPEVVSGITFYPWMYYIPGVVYAEHGHQYDASNSFATLLEPYRPHNPDAIELPLGSFFVVYLFNRIEAIDPFADNVKPASRYLLWALRTRPITALATLSYHASFFIRVLDRSGKRPVAELKQQRRDYRETVLRAYAEQSGLPFATLEELDRLGAIPAMTSKLRQLEALLLEPLLTAVPVLASLVALYRVIQRMSSVLRLLITFSFGMLFLLWRERRSFSGVTEPSSYLWQAAVKIDKLLAQTGHATPLYVFGHTHTAEQFPLHNDPDAPRYLNSGTWTPIVPEIFDLLGTRERFTFIQITRDPRDGRVIGQLLIWNDAANRSSPLPLLMR